MKKYDYTILIGRFQPFHNAHHALLKEALRLGEEVVVVVGSARVARSIKNPWSAEDRINMIKSTMSQEELDRTYFVELGDYLYNDTIWVTDLQQKIYNVAGDSDKVAIVGHQYDRSSYYLDLFPQWDFVNVPHMDEHPHATEIRMMYFTGNYEYAKHLPVNVASQLDFESRGSQYDDFQKELQYLLKYAQSWEKAPFPPTFVTVDAVVVKSGHVLVVRRKGYPGKGLIALPGGFLKSTEFIRDGAVRELKEETGIKVPKAELFNSIIDQRVFDHPERSLRGRTITHAYLMDLKSGPLPRVKGADDADKAWWMPLNELFARESEFFEDHWHIVNYFVNRF